jgi:HrpA-like RNA helicase
MLDDIHERSINTDVLIGFLKKIMFKRRDLKLILSSATLDVDQFQRFF